MSENNNVTKILIYLGLQPLKQLLKPTQNLRKHFNVRFSAAQVGSE